MAKDSSYFTGDRDFWDDGDFDTMEEQCVYAMLWQAHGTDIAGIRQRNDRLDAVRVHLTESEFQDTLSQLQEKGKITLFPSQIWIKAGIWRNLNKGNYSLKQMEGVLTRLKGCSRKSLPTLIVEYYKKKYNMDIPYAYPIIEPEIPYPSVTVSVPVSETVPESVSGTVPESGIKSKSHCASATDVPSQKNGKHKYEPKEELRREDATRIVQVIENWDCMKGSKMYQVAGKIRNILSGKDADTAIQILKEKSEHLSKMTDIHAFYAYLTGIYRKSDDIGEIESRAHQHDDGTARGGDPKRINEVMEE